MSSALFNKQRPTPLDRRVRAVYEEYKYKSNKLISNIDTLDQTEHDSLSYITTYRSAFKLYRHYKAVLLNYLRDSVYLRRRGESSVLYDESIYAGITVLNRLVINMEYGSIDSSMIPLLTKHSVTIGFNNIDLFRQIEYITRPLDLKSRHRCDSTVINSWYRYVRKDMGVYNQPITHPPFVARRLEIKRRKAEEIRRIRSVSDTVRGKVDSEFYDQELATRINEINSSKKA